MKLLPTLSLIAAAWLAAPALAQTPGFSTVVEFTGTSGLKVGAGPAAALMEHSDGNLYGSTFSGGASNYGTYYKLSKTGTFTSLKALTGNTGVAPGFYPSCTLAENSDGTLFGMNGGNNALGAAGLGNTFKITTAGAYTFFFGFAGQGATNRGSTPYSGLIRVGSDFYGTTNAGGAFTNHGTLLRVSSTGFNTYLLDFTSTGASNRGSQPWAHLLNGGDGYLYGSTYAGGGGGFGTIFKYHIATNVLSTLVEFTGTSSPKPGKYPADKLLLASDGNLYGTTANGGALNAGTIFRVNPSTGAFATLVEFSNNTGASQGAGPFGGLVQGPDGYIYGTTEYNGPGATGDGTIFRLSLTGQFTPKLVEFSGSTTPHKGSHPFGGLMKTTEGIIYGTTIAGGADNQGTIWKLDTSLLPQAPVVTTTAATAVTATGATLNGTINPKSLATAWQFEYGTTTAYGTSVPTTPGSLAAGNTAQAVSFTLTGLAANTLYHYRLKASSTAGLSAGSDGTFTTGAGSAQAPVVVTGAASSVTASTATLNGTVNPQGNAASWQFEYGTTTSYGSVLPVVAGTTGSGSSAEAVSVNLSDLPGGTTIHYRLKATNTGGTTLGTDQTFTTTGSAQAPAVVTGGATQITGASAVLNGTVNPRGSVTTWQFSYGTSVSASGNTAPVSPATIGDGITPEAVNIPITGLTPGTTIYYKLIASNGAGTTTGTTGTFTTAIAPDAVTMVAADVTNTEVTLVGTVDPNGSESLWQFDYGTDTGYGSVAPAIAGTTGTGTSPELVTYTLTNLAPGTVIHYRLRASNGAGSSTGQDFTVTTLQPPTVTTQVQNVSATSATLAGTVNPNGFATTWQFDFGTTTTYGTSLPAVAGNLAAGSTPQSVSVPVSSLLPNTTYHFRLRATSARGTTTGPDVVFTTNNNLTGWRQINFGTTANTGDAANDADPDRDGVINLLEYSYGMNPKLADQQLLPTPAYNGSTLIASFVSPEGVFDITYGAEVSTNLRDWAPLADSGTGRVHSFSSPVSSSGEHFMRLRVRVIP